MVPHGPRGRGGRRGLLPPSRWRLPAPSSFAAAARRGSASTRRISRSPIGRSSRSFRRCRRTARRSSSLDRSMAGGDCSASGSGSPKPWRSGQAGRTIVNPRSRQTAGGLRFARTATAAASSSWTRTAETPCAQAPAVITRRGRQTAARWSSPPKISKPPTAATASPSCGRSMSHREARRC